MIDLGITLCDLEMVFFQAGETSLHVAVRHCHFPVADMILKFTAKKHSRHDLVMLVNEQNEVSSQKPRVIFKLFSNIFFSPIYAAFILFYLLLQVVKRCCFVNAIGETRTRDLSTL